MPMQTELTPETIADLQRITRQLERAFSRAHYQLVMNGKHLTRAEFREASLDAVEASRVATCDLFALLGRLTTVM